MKVFYSNAYIHAWMLLFTALNSIPLSQIRAESAISASCRPLAENTFTTISLQQSTILVFVYGDQVIDVKEVQFTKDDNFGKLFHIPGIHRVINGFSPVFVVLHDFSIEFIG